MNRFQSIGDECLHLVYNNLTADDGLRMRYVSLYHRRAALPRFIAFNELSCVIGDDGACMGVSQTISSDVISLEIARHSNVCLQCIYNIFDEVSRCEYLHTFVMHLYCAANDVPIDYIEWLVGACKPSLKLISCTVSAIDTPESQERLTRLRNTTSIDIRVMWSRPPR